MLARKALGWAALAGAMFMLCRGEVLGFRAPLAMAFLASALLAGKSAAALLAGCIAGALNGSIRDFNLRLPLGAAIVLGGSMLWEQLGPELTRRLRNIRWPGSSGLRTASEPAPGMKARSPNPATSALCSVLAGAATLIPGLFFSGEALWPAAAQTVAASVAAVAAAPFFGSALTAGRGRRWLSQEEQAGSFLILGALAGGLAQLYLPLAVSACGALALILYPCGSLAGVGFGMSLLAAGQGNEALAVVIAVGGATAQLCGETSRQSRALSACGAMLTASLLLNVPPVMLAGAGFSALATLLLPQEWIGSISRLTRPEPGPGDPQRLADQARRESARQLRAMSDAFGELAEGYLTPTALPDEQALISRLRERLCDGCGSYEKCWMGERNDGARFLCDLVARAVAQSGEAPLFEGEVTPEILRRCRRGRLIPERVQDMLEDFARARRSELKRGAENRLISAQFLQARRLLDGLAERQEAPIQLRARDAKRAAAALDMGGVETESVLAVGGGGSEIIATLRQGSWTPELARRASAQLAAVFGRRYTASEPVGRGMRFKRRPRLGVATGVVCTSRQAGVPSGDSHVICMLDDERLLALICDGMGSGADAARESGLAVRLLGRFLKAGADCGLAVETVNALLMNRSGEDMFATVDMLILNLSTGEAEFIKLAASPTLIARGGEVLRVEGGRLPMGILEKVQPGVSHARLIPGDVLLMGSDGVMDAAGEGTLERLLLGETENMPALAHKIQAEAERACDAGHRDDMTTVCLRVGLRGRRN